MAQVILDIQAALAGANPNETPAPDQTEAMDIAATAKALTGKSSVAEVKGVLQAAFNAKVENLDLIKRLNALESERAKDIIDRSKLTPAQKSWAQSQLNQPHGFETVKSFIEASSKDVPLGPNAPLVQPPVTQAPESEEPSKEVVSYCQSKQMDAKVYFKNWKIINPKKAWTKELA
jgi:hypothetical protein